MKALKIYSSILDVIEKILVVIGAVILVALTLDVMTQVIARYIYNNPPFWTEEIARVLAILIVFCVGAVAYRRSELTGITFLVDSLPGIWQKICWIFVHTCILAFSVYLVINARAFIQAIGVQKYPATGLRKAWMYGAFCGYGVINTLFAIEMVLKTIFRKFDRKEAANK